MLENPEWFLRDLSKRNVVVMSSRKAVRILSRAHIATDNVNVQEVRSGKRRIVPISELYEPSNGNEWRGYALNGAI